MLDPLGRTDYLVKEYQDVSPSHRPDCQFGNGFYRVVYKDGGVTHKRYFQDKDHADFLWRVLPDSARVRIQRDACLDWKGQVDDASTPDVIDGELWLAMPREQAMAEVGLTNEADYTRVYNAVQDAVYTRGNEESQGGVHASIVLRRKGTSRKPMLNIKPLQDNPGLL